MFDNSCAADHRGKVVVGRGGARRSRLVAEAQSASRLRPSLLRRETDDEIKIKAMTIRIIFLYWPRGRRGWGGCCVGDDERSAVNLLMWECPQRLRAPRRAGVGVAGTRVRAGMRGLSAGG